jgi:mRNA interferase MazF
MNEEIRTVVVAPLTSSNKRYSYRVESRFGGVVGQIAIDQMRCVDRRRLVKRLGRLDPQTAKRILNVLAEMFAP